MDVYISELLIDTNQTAAGPDPQIALFSSSTPVRARGRQELEAVLLLVANNMRISRKLRSRNFFMCQEKMT